MLISIIVPVYKVEAYLRRCVNSVLSQTYTHWELILVDDGSPDGCPAICDEYAANDKRIRVLHKQNGGLSSARNEGLRLANGEFITFVDSDDFIHPHTLQDVVSLAKDNAADIVQFSFIRGNVDEFPMINRAASICVYDNHSIFYSTNQKIIACGKLYRRELWSGVSFPLGRINEDDATTWRLYYRANKIVYVNTPYYYYYQNPNSIMAVQHKRAKLDDFIVAYQERISFFQDRKEELLVALSQWRFCMPLMLVYMRGNITAEEKDLLLSLFRKNVGAAVGCKKVPFKYRALLSAFNVWPQFFRFIFVLLGRAHTLK